MIRYVLPRQALPTYYPIQTTAIVYLLLDRFDPPGWAHGVVWSFVVLLWVMAGLIRHGQIDKPLPGYGDVK